MYQELNMRIIHLVIEIFAMLITGVIVHLKAFSNRIDKGTELESQDERQDNKDGEK